MLRAAVMNRPARPPAKKKACGCVGERGPRPPAKMRAARVMRDSTPAEHPKDVEPIILGSERGKCAPFLKVEKDAEKFAACNALSDEIGPLDDPKKAFKVIEQAIGDEVNEVFGLITLDLHMRLKSFAITGRGEATSVMAPIVPTLQAAVLDGAHAVIIFHVHPSGVEAEPSEADIETTEAFADAFETIQIGLLDHIIIAGDIRNPSYYSFLENNAL